MTNLAARLQSLDPAAKRAMLSKLVGIKRSQGRTAPLSYAQRRLWFLEQLVPGSPSYNETSTLRLLVPVDADALGRSLDEIVRRHESLRTVFESVDGEPAQRVLPTLPVSLRVVPVVSADAAARMAAALAAEPFDLSRGPLVRAALLRLGPADHVLMLSMHHIVCDGWSMRVFFGELQALYQAFVAGRPSPLPELTIQYTDFAEWQRIWLDGPRLREQLSFWTSRLSGLSNLDLPTDRRRPTIPSFHGATQRIAIPPSTARQLRSLCEREGVTPFMAMLTAFQALLHRYSGQDDLAVGCPVAGRSRPELEPLIGFFINTLVMRGDCSGNPSLRDALRRTRETALSAYAHQDLPFERLVEELQPQRDPSRNPLFQVTFQMLSEGGGAASDLLRPFDVAPPAAKFDLQCDLWPEGDGIGGHLVYATDLFYPDTAEAMARHFEALVAAMARAPEQRIADVPLLTAAQARQMLTDWNATAVNGPDRPPVHRRFEEAARTFPDHLAVADGVESLSYAALDRRADRLARRLTARGVGPGVPVAIVMDRSVGLIEAVLAVLKAGATYVPLDPAYPPERIAAVIRDASIPLALVSARHRERLPGDIAVLCATPEPDADGEPPSSAADCAADGDAPAYVIFTSGSTGKPRGVEVGHAALNNLIDWHLRAYAVTPDDRAMLYASPGFDASVWEMWPYLVAGASLHVPDEGLRADPAGLARWMAEAGITLGFLPTPVAESFVEQEMPSTLRLRVLLTGGDRLRRPPARPLRFRFVNHYGPTENTVVATAGDIEPGESWGEPSIGRPIANVAAYVLDRGGWPVPVGVKGELCLGGAQVARGYHGAPALTAERFVTDPFDRRPGARLYRTGDLVRWRRDGTLEFHGRIDGQFKIRGHRIEPGEVEGVLDHHPAVAKSLVAAAEGPDGRHMLVAYLTLRDPAADGPDLVRSLRRHAREQLPEAMVPAAYVTMDALPLTAHGKFDRRALPAVVGDASETVDPDAGSGLPEDPIQARLTAIWREALRNPQIGVHDNFFDVGGHSLLLIKVHTAMRSAFSTTLSVVDLFRLPTIAELARAIASERGQPLFQASQGRPDEMAWPAETTVRGAP